ncbi:MAG: hypothetical protein ABSA96_06970 [Candidatus Acidiferrales bacterium]
MSRRVLQFSLAVAVLSVMSIPVLARPSSKDSLSTTISLVTAVNVGNKMIEPGEYKVVVQDNSAKFEKDGKVVAEAPCTLKTLPTKAHETAVSVDHDKLTEIQISGKTQALEFSSGAASGN